MKENERPKQRQFEDYKSIDDIRKYMEHVEVHMKSYIESAASK